MSLEPKAPKKNEMHILPQEPRRSISNPSGLLVLATARGCPLSLSPFESASALNSQGISKAFRLLVISRFPCTQLHLGVDTNTYYCTGFKS